MTLMMSSNNTPSTQAASTDKIVTETYVKSYSTSLMREQVSFYDYGPGSRCF